MADDKKTRAQLFREGIEADATSYLIAALGEREGKLAGARVAMAFAAAARAAKDPEALYNCSRASFVACVAMSAITKLMPGGPAPTVYLVPRAGELKWEITHRGIAALALRAGWQLIAVPVHKADSVKLSFGEVIEHEADPDRWPDSIDDLRGVYLTIRRISDGAQLGHPWMPIGAIKKRMAKAQTQGVWREWAVEQAQKTTIKWANSRGFLPIDVPELTQALEAEEHETIDVNVDEPQSQQQPTGRGALGLPDQPTVPEDRRLPAPPPEVPDALAREPEVIEAKPKATTKPKAATAPAPAAATAPNDDDMP